MTSESKGKYGNPPDPRLPSQASLVPLYAGPDIVPGIQAFRRGNLILYTVRGEPEEALELMGQLARDGVGEVIALISHRALEEPPPDDDEEDGDGKYPPDRS